MSCLRNSLHDGQSKLLHCETSFDKSSSGPPWTKASDENNIEPEEKQHQQGFSSSVIRIVTACYSSLIDNDIVNAWI